MTSENVAHVYTEIAARREGVGGYVAHAYVEMAAQRNGVGGQLAHAYLEITARRPTEAEEIMYGLPLVGVMR